MRHIYEKELDGTRQKIEYEDEALDYKIDNSWLFSVFIKFDNFDESAEGYEEFLETKEALIIAIEYEDTAKYVATRVVDGWSELYFYASDSKGFNSTVADILNPSKYIFESNIVKDSKWHFFETQILPNELEYHHIVSSHIISLLKDEDDSLEASREVEHYAFFDTQTQKERFIELACEAGFTYKDDLSSEEGEHGVAVIKEHTMIEDEVKSVVETIYELIKQEHGRYEGWSTTLLEQ